MDAHESGKTERIALQNVAAKLASRFTVPNLAVALVSGSDQHLIVHSSVPASGGPPTAGPAWFQAASSGKHVIACALLRLVARGAINLNAPIGRYLRDLPAAWRTCSVWSLLHHTSGLPDYLSPDGTAAAPADRTAFMRRAADLPPMADEGRLWSYSNSNYILLGFLIAEAGEHPAGIQMQMLLDETGSGAAVASPDWVRHANAERLGPDARDRASLNREVIGDGDVAFTVVGAANWMQRLLSDPPGGERLFEPALVDGVALPYACGLFVERSGSDMLAHHGGHYDGWTAMLLLNRTQRAGVFVLADVAPGNTRAVRAIAQEMLEAYRPGATPLASTPIRDAAPAQTAIVRGQMLRRERPIDLDRFAPSLRLAIERAGQRGVLNLWSGVEPTAFDLVDEQPEPGRTTRRYRLTYQDRVEHLLAGISDDGLIDWAWPL